MESCRRKVTEQKNKTVDVMKNLKELGMCELSLGVESGDDRIRNSIRIAICRMIPLSFNVLFTEQDSIDFEPALFSFGGSE